MLSDSQKVETLEHVRNLLKTLPEEERPEREEPQAKKQRTAFDEFDDDDDNVVEVVDEITVYQNMSVGPVTQGKLCINLIQCLQCQCNFTKIIFFN